MPDRKIRCPSCDRKVWVLANDDGKYRWERHKDKSGDSDCPFSGRTANPPK